MQRPFMLFLLLALLFSGCYKVNKLGVKKPANLIPKNKMAEILTDMEIVQGIAIYNREHYPEYKNVGENYYKTLYDRYHVTKSQIRTSLDYYNNQGDEMANIYDMVMSKLTEKQAILNEEQRMREAKKHFKEDSGKNFPFLFREDSFANLCINPII